MEMVELGLLPHNSLKKHPADTCCVCRKHGALREKPDPIPLEDLMVCLYTRLRIQCDGWRVASTSSSLTPEPGQPVLQGV